MHFSRVASVKRGRSCIPGVQVQHHVQSNQLVHAGESSRALQIAVNHVRVVVVVVHAVVVHAVVVVSMLEFTR